MAVKAVCVFLLVFPAIAFCATRGLSCTTPNGEVASCTPLRRCKVIFDAVSTRKKDAVAFAKASQCGYDTEPLVCCGASGYPSKTVVTSVSALLPDRTKCGLTKAFRVVGGELTQIWEHPWLALLSYRNFDGSDAGFQCGGTLINNRYVLTAAHCVIISNNQGFDLNSVRLGEWRISTVRDCEADLVNEECADPVIDIGIEDRIVNRQYESRSSKNDIALLRLARNVKYTDYIRAICLPQPNAPVPADGTKMVVVGWGATENSSTSDDKLKVVVPIVSQSSCSAKLKNKRRKLTEDQLCAGGVSGKDSCRGDSGGPLMGSYAKKIGETDQWYQEGVVSWGVGCGVAGYPAIYTRVSRYMSWIVDNLKPF